jgi:hypothetical protein
MVLANKTIAIQETARFAKSIVTPKGWDFDERIRRAG